MNRRRVESGLSSEPGEFCFDTMPLSICVTDGEGRAAFHVPITANGKVITGQEPLRQITPMARNGSKAHRVMPAPGGAGGLRRNS